MSEAEIRSKMKGEERGKEEKRGKGEGERGEGERGWGWGGGVVWPQRFAWSNSLVPSCHSHGSCSSWWGWWLQAPWRGRSGRRRRRHRARRCWDERRCWGAPVLGQSPSSWFPRRTWRPRTCPCTWPCRPVQRRRSQWAPSAGAPQAWWGAALASCTPRTSGWAPCPL